MFDLRHLIWYLVDLKFVDHTWINVLCKLQSVCYVVGINCEPKWSSSGHDRCHLLAKRNHYYSRVRYYFNIITINCFQLQLIEIILVTVCLCAILCCVGNSCIKSRSFLWSSFLYNVCGTTESVFSAQRRISINSIVSCLGSRTTAFAIWNIA